jgi:hypothetical protein
MKPFHQILNDYRVFPRVFAVFYMWGMSESVEWALSQPQLSTEHSALVIAIVTGGAAYFKFYVETGAAKE